MVIKTKEYTNKHDLDRIDVSLNKFNSNTENPIQYTIVDGSRLENGKSKPAKFLVYTLKQSDNDMPINSQNLLEYTVNEFYKYHEKRIGA